MSDYELLIVDERSRSLNAEQIEWELNGGRAVRVVARLEHGTRDSTHPQASVEIFEDEDRGQTYAIVVLPPNGKIGGMLAEHLPAFREVLRVAQGIADEANARIEAERREDEAEVCA